ncbi:6,7-dimethyl-8-ribityllumazine synthase [Pseudomonadota bacterium]
MSRHVLMIVAPFYKHITDQLIAGASAELAKDDITFDLVEVPGAMEIPAIVHLAETSYKNDPHEAKYYDGFVALGCVIRGETSHYDYVAGECCRALMDLTLQGLAIGNGVLTVENEEQALVRSDPSKKNKGAAAAEACMAVMSVRSQLRGGINQ